MLSTLRNAWKVPELRKRLLYTIFLIAIFRMGNHIPVPGIDTARLAEFAGQSGNLINFYDLISGGAFSSFSVFALGVIPYINASIIMQLLTIAIPQLEQLSKEGEEGRRKIQNMTRYAAIPIGVLQAYGAYLLIRSQNAIVDTSMVNVVMIVVTLIAASTFLMWMGDMITVKGLGNGVSLIIFVNILSKFPTTIYQISALKKGKYVGPVEIAIFILVILALLIAVIGMSLAERRIPVQYAGKAIGNKVFKGQSSHIPISITGSAVIAIIFAMSVMEFPYTIGQFWPASWFNKVIVNGVYSPFKRNSIMYVVLYAILTIFFTWFYTQVTFKPEEMAENMGKSAGFIPGVRPGNATAKYLERILDRISVIGGVFAAVIAIFPIILATYTSFQGISFGGTMLLIMVGVSLDTLRQIESQLVMRHYQGFLK
ncbi:preprotein translocase subunit SecY [Clostridium sp. MSJ-4]|uniref:Protein translocase subunit SecY n=1 Tax=Clostridium simiarum TaxID=2841506 RepID=A0ABS6EZU5_9CLOT|nr:MULTISPECIES: preprotein translocase subunit SecY [Clostridium]MBU5591762.1 preprotein translocase subunit SecY [Clostridium simiarum]